MIEQHRLIRGDAVARLRRLDDESVDAIVTDPPYGIELKLGTRRRGARSIVGDGRKSAVRLWSRWLPEAARVARPDTLHCVFGTWKSPWMPELLAKHFRVVGCVVWDKRIIGLGHHLRPRWEQIYVVAKGRPPRRGSAPADVWDVARLHKTRHPCEKPVALLRRCVELVSDEGQLVLDPFAGIASTGLAAAACGRRFLGFELDPQFVPIGRRRLIEASSTIAPVAPDSRAAGARRAAATTNETVAGGGSAA